MTASMKLITGTMNGRLILNKLGRRRVQLCQRVMANAAMFTVKMWAFWSGFSCPIQTLLILASILLGSGKATHSELLGMKRVNIKPEVSPAVSSHPVNVGHEHGTHLAASWSSHLLLPPLKDKSLVLTASDFEHRSQWVSVKHKTAHQNI